jgi:hypothetical protein
MNRKFINDSYWDKSFDYIAEQLGRDQVLHIETPSPAFVDSKQTISKYIVSELLFRLIARILRLMLFPRIDGLQLGSKIFPNKTVASNILRNESLAFYSLFRIYKFWFSVLKPKAIFVDAAYGACYITHAAKKLNILVVEVQHGVIGQKHPGYHIYNKNFSDYFPDYLLTFGDVEKKSLANSFYLKNDNIISVGSFAIEKFKKIHIESAFFKHLRSKYKLLVCISDQRSCRNELVDLVAKLSIELPSIAFYYLPRDKDSECFKRIAGLTNVYLDSSRSIYAVFNYVDVHLTCFSTCALEAPCFGVPNLLYDCNGVAKSYYGSLLDFRTTIFRSTIKEMANELRNYKKENFKFDNYDLIKENYCENVLCFLKNIL